jgi:hypothetical protein
MKSGYDHLNIDDPLRLTVDMDDLARRVVAMNYGTVRFLAALVRARRESRKFHVICTANGEVDQLADGIEALLERGLF